MQIFKIVFVLLTVVLFAVFYWNNSASKINSFFPTIGYTIIAILYSYIIYFTVFSKNVIWNSIINNNWLVFIGKISFGLYIFHVPIFFLLEIILTKMSLNLHCKNYFKIIFVGLLSFTITFMISRFSYKYFESYFLRKKIKIVI